MPNDSTPDIKTVGQWLDLAKTQIAPTEAEYIAVFNFAPMDQDRSWLVTHMDTPIPVDPINNVSLAEPANAMVKKRLAGLPIQYVLGIQEFYGREFRISQDVLIPRPESEDIINLAKELALPATARILDLGTGSGILAITLALEFPQATVLGADISEPALKLAEMNDSINEGRATFIYSDLLSNIYPEGLGSIDLLVANLPYVNPDWDWLDKDSLSYEPAIALYPEQGNAENGLSLYHRLFDELAEYTRATSVNNLIFEADPCQHEELIALATSYSWRHHATKGYALAFKPAKA